MDGGTSLEGTARERAASLGLAFGVGRPVDVEPALEQLRGLAVRLAARGENPAASDRCCIAGFGATLDFHHGLLGATFVEAFGIGMGAE